MDANHDDVLDALLAQVIPLVEPPAGDLPDANLVGALVEGRLPPGVAHRVTRQIERSPAARAELRALFPERFAEIFEAPPAPPATVPRATGASTRGWRGPLYGALTLVAAAALAFFLVPPKAPSGSALEVARDSKQNVRGPATPGSRFAVSMKLGEPSRLDALRGKQPFGALLVTDPSGYTRLVCTTVDRQRCTAAEGTLGYLFVAPSAKGAYTLSLLSTPEPLAPSDLTALLGQAQRASTPLDALETAARKRNGKLLRAEPIQVE